MKIYDLSESEKNKVAFEFYAAAQKYIKAMPKSAYKKILHKDDFKQDLVTTLWATCENFDESKGTFNEYQNLVFKMVEGTHTFNFNEFLENHSTAVMSERFDPSLSYKQFDEIATKAKTSPLLYAEYLHVNFVEVATSLGVSKVGALCVLTHDNVKFNNVNNLNKTKNRN